MLQKFPIGHITVIVVLLLVSFSLIVGPSALKLLTGIFSLIYGIVLVLSVVLLAYIYFIFLIRRFPKINSKISKIDKETIQKLQNFLRFLLISSDLFNFHF